MSSSQPLNTGPMQARGGVRALRALASPLRERPSFLVIGAQKAGTTTLAHELTRHPQIGETFRKEIHYFDNNFHRPRSWYLGHFPARRPGRRRLVGDASPYYLFHPHVPERAHALVPEARLVALLRDPVARAISHYNHSRSRNFEPLRFEEAIEREDERLAGEAEKLADPAYVSRPHRNWSYLSRGRYAEQLERWLAVFPRDQLLVLWAEDFFARPAETYRRVIAFLGAADHDPGQIAPRNQAKVTTDVAPGTLARLREHFAPHDARLAELVGAPPPWTD